MPAEENIRIITVIQNDKNSKKQDYMVEYNDITGQVDNLSLSEFIEKTAKCSQELADFYAGYLLQSGEFCHEKIAMTI